MNESEYAEPPAYEGETRRRFVSAKFAADELGCTPREVYYRMDDGRLDWVRDGRRRLVVRASLERYIEKLLEQPTAGRPAA